MLSNSAMSPNALSIPLLTSDIRHEHFATVLILLLEHLDG